MKFWAGLIIGIAATMVVVMGWRMWPRSKVEMPVVVKEYPLQKYAIENLAARQEWGGVIELGEITATESGYIARKFYFDSDGKRVSGLMHIPDECVKCPTVVQFRGYYDRETYFSGAGTYRTASEFARAGMVSIAPDFLGFGESASPSADVFEARFQTYTAAVNLLYSIKSLNFVDNEKIGIWGHSNGGHIALTALEITGRQYPTVLWAPVTAVFPYSILYYTDDYDDEGWALRQDLARFEEDYDVNKFTLVNYLEKVQAPMLLLQGTVDLDIPLKWSRGIVDQLEKLEKDVEYREYSGADHNMVPRWNEAVGESIEFFRKSW